MKKLIHGIVTIAFVATIVGNPIATFAVDIQMPGVSVKNGKISITDKDAVVTERKDATIVRTKNQVYVIKKSTDGSYSSTNIKSYGVRSQKGAAILNSTPTDSNSADSVLKVTTPNSGFVYSTGQSTPVTSETSKTRTVDEALIQKILSDRIQFPDRYENRPEILLNFKPNKLAQAVQDGIKDPTSLKVDIAANQSSPTFGTVTDPESGMVFQFNRTAEPELEEMSPKKFSHFHAFKNATNEAFGPWGKNFAVEALSFYAGVGANNVFNLLTKYEKNPMALEQFAEELKDPVAQMGFFAFMVGNRYAQTLFQDMLARSQSKVAQRVLGPMLGFLAMGVGSMFSNISHDLLTLTKGCAVALSNVNKPEYDTSEKRAAKCQEGWDAVMTSDNLARYVTSMGSVIVSSLASAALTTGYKAGAKLGMKALPIDGVKVIFNRMVRNKVVGSAALKAVELAPAGRGIVRFGVKTLDLVIFLQADELMSPGIHYLVETAGNSGPKLSLVRHDVTELMKSLDDKKWNDNEDSRLADMNCKQPVMLASQQWTTQDCTEGYGKLYQSFENFAEKNKKWRETLNYEFMNSYMNWVRFVSEFTVMHDVSREFFARLVAYSSNVEGDKNAYSYNPLAVDNPFYGVNLSENLPVSDTEDFRGANKSKAMRVVETLPKINELLSIVSVKGYDETVKPLREIKSLLEAYQAAPTLANQDKVAKALSLINGLAEEARKLKNVSRINYTQYNLNASAQQMGVEKKIALIAAIKTYVGNSTPLKAGAEAFYQTFNDFVKADKPDYIKLFDEKGTPAETITWYAVCGNDLSDKDAKVDKRRTGFASAIDSGINFVLKGINDRFKGTPMESQYKEISPALNAFEAIKFGTGVDFYIPRISKAHMNFCAADKDILKYGIGPKAHMRIKGPDGKEYSSMFDYLQKNIQDDVSKNFDGWWKEQVTPKYESAFVGFTKDYQVLLNNTYRSALDGETSRGSDGTVSSIRASFANAASGNSSRNDSSMLGLQQVISKQRVRLTGNARNISQSYVDELTTYLAVIDRVYSTSDTTNKDSLQNTKLFRERLSVLRSLVLDLLNDFRNFNTKGLKTPNVKDDQYGVPHIVGTQSPQLDYQKKYALILLYTQQVFGALGFGNQLVDAAANNTVYFASKKDKKEIDSFGPMARLGMRVSNDPAIKETFETYAQNLDGTQRALPTLSYDLGENNIKEMRDGIRMKPEVVGVKLVNFNNNDRLTMATIASNSLFLMLEDLYTNMAMLNATRSDTTYKAVDVPQNATHREGSLPK